MSPTPHDHSAEGYARATMAYEALGLVDLDIDTAVAVHEAGHAWAYTELGLPIRYLTLRPRRSDQLGRVAVRPRTISMPHQSLTALAGPLAESMYVEQADPCAHPDDLLTHALEQATSDSAAIEPALLDLPGWREGVRGQLAADWKHVMTLAEALAAARTIHGGHARIILSSEHSRSPRLGRISP